MKIKDSTRTRLIGYFGIAVTTLLTPGGKLISSAIAAATVAGVVSMSLPSKEEKTSQPAPAIAHTSTANIDNELLNVGDLAVAEKTPDTLSAETLASDQYSAQAVAPAEIQSGVVLTMQTGSPGDLAYAYDAPNGGSTLPPSLIPSGPKSPSQPLLAGSPGDTLPLGGDAAPSDSNNPVLDGQPALASPEILALLDPVKNTDPVKEEKDFISIPEDVPFPADGFSPITASQPLAPTLVSQPLLVLAAAEISEPPTLGLLLLGLIGFGGLYRNKQFG